jgi:hypothetical protein
MSSYPGLKEIGQEYILEEQYKALFGYPNGKVNFSLSSEVPGTSRPFILQNQIYSQEIPITPPTNPDNLGETGSTSIAGNTYYYNYSTNYPYLKKYIEVPLSNSFLSQASDGGALTWWFEASGQTGVRSTQLEYNILSQGVPNNLDPNNGYVPTLYIVKDGTSEEYNFGNGYYPWTYNVNSGIVLFTGDSKYSGTGSPNNNTPSSTDTITFTFWRYEGTIGITGSTGDSYWEATGTTGIQYGALSVETDSNNTGSIYTQNILAKDTISNVNLYTNLITDGSLTIGSTGSTSTFNSALVVGGTATFYNYAPVCGVTATDDNDLVNKGYVDSSFVSSKSTVPTVKFGTVTSNTSNIYIPIEYPAQIYNGAIPAPVPVIAGSIFNFTTDTYSTQTTILGITGATAFNPYYVRPLSFYNGTMYFYPGSDGPGSTNYTGLQGIILSNSFPTNLEPQNRDFGNTTRYSIIYNTGSITGNTGTISGQYYDYADYSGLTSISFDWYTTGRKPGTTGSSWSTPQSSYDYINLTYTPPNEIQEDVRPNVSGVIITNFQGTYKTIGNTISYLGPTGEIGSKVFSYNGPYASPQSNNQFSNLYPESQYYFGLYSQNSATTTYSDNVYPNDAGVGSGYGFTGATTSILQINSNYLPSSVNVNTNFNGQIFSTPFVTGKTIYKVSDTVYQNITNLFFNTNIETKGFTAFSVSYNDLSRGKNGQNKKLMDINTNITDNTNTYDSTVSFNGFPEGNASITSSNNITYSRTPTTSDMYSNKLQGYYLISNTFTESFTALSASSNLYTTTLTQKWYNINESPIGGTGSTSTSQSFYYDTLNGNPSINSSSSYSFNDGTTGKMSQVSGINVIGATAIFNLSINVTNLYNYFYVSPVLNYVFTGGCTANTNVLNLSNYNNDTFTLDSITTNNISSTFKNSQTLNATANNLNGSTTTTINLTSSSKNAIYDKPSYTFINTFPTSIPTILETNSEKVGFRVWSNVDSTAVNPDGNAVIPPNYTYSNESYSQFKYNQSWSIGSSATSITTPDYPVNTNINTSQEIQIYNGHYGTGKTETGGTGINGYINYSSYYNNSLDYSGVSRGATNYRYTTFVWKAQISGTQPNNFVFTFKNIKVNDSTAQLNSSPNNSLPYYFSYGSINYPRFFLFYRTEQFDNASSNSLWVDGNSNYGTKFVEPSNAELDTTIQQLSPTNYNDPYDNKTVRAPNSINCSLNNNGDLVAQVSVVPINYGLNVYIYCRFGNSMGYNITYESVSLTLT